MIKIKQLTDADKGRWVTYRATGGDKVELGRIKSWNKTVVFVVYACDDDWDRYKDFTGAATDPDDLEFNTSQLDSVKLKPFEIELAQRISREVWQKYDDTHGYRTEKLAENDRVSPEHPDNIWFFWGQFDSNNHQEFFDRLCDEHNDDPGAPGLMAWTLKERQREASAVADLKAMGIEL